jgi:hypothetical protein
VLSWATLSSHLPSHHKAEKVPITGPIARYVAFAFIEFSLSFREVVFPSATTCMASTTQTDPFS